MTAKVLPLGPTLKERTRLEANQAIVTQLEELLARAKLGEITSMAACWQNIDRTITTWIEVSEDRFAMSHALSALHWRMHFKLNQDAESND